MIATYVYDALPRAAQDFLRLSDIELRWYAESPDHVAGDNILTTGCDEAVEEYAHSYKIAWDRTTDTMTLIHGSAPVTIAETPRLCRNAIREGRFDASRASFGELMHYTVDVCTIWHLTQELTSAQHKQGEVDLWKRAKSLLQHPSALPLPNPKSLAESAETIAKQTLRTQLDRVKTAQDHGHVTADMTLAHEMVQRSADFALAASLYTWRYMANAIS